MKTISLVYGPNDGETARVPRNTHDCWQKAGNDWAYYVLDLFTPNRFVWAGVILDEDELKAKITADTENTYGASEAA